MTERNIRYEIDAETFAITMWDGINEDPFMFQPWYPDSTPWADAADADRWAQLKVAELTDNTAPRAGNSPDQLTIPRPTAEQERASAIAMTGYTEEELRLLLDGPA